MAERVAFRMRVHPGKIAEYKKRHDEIWPELAQALRDAGVTDYSIWHDPETNYLLATLLRRDGHTMAALPTTDANMRWWALMDDIMDYNDDGTPTAVDLVQVFHLP